MASTGPVPPGPHAPGTPGGEPPADPPVPQNGGSAWESRVNKALVGVASGIGLATFVVAVGAAIHWARFKALGLPANHATLLVPRDELLVTGAAFLIPAVFFAAVAVFVMFAMDWAFNVDPKRTNTELFDVKTAKELQSTPKADTRKREVRRRLILVWVVLVGLSSGLLFARVNGLPLEEATLRGAVVAAAAGLTGTVLHRTGNLWLFAPLTFALMMVIAAASTLERTYFDPRAEPAALVYNIGAETGKKVGGQGRAQAVAGLMVAERDKEIWLGIGTKRSEERKAGRIFSVKRDGVTDLSIGPLMKPGDALRRAPELAAELCAHGAVQRRRCPRLDSTLPVSVDIFPTLNRVAVSPEVIALHEQANPGAEFVFSVSGTPTITFGFHQGTKGREVRKRCVKRNDSNRKRRSCNRFKLLGEPIEVEVEKPGLQKMRLPRGGDKVPLAPGFYRVTLLAQDDQGQQSRPAHVHLRVVR